VKQKLTDNSIFAATKITDIISNTITRNHHIQSDTDGISQKVYITLITADTEVKISIATVVNHHT